jgi:hypothetical protein
MGDIIIALPIAAWYIARGHEVYWAVSSLMVDCLEQAAPYVRFLGVDVGLLETQRLEYFWLTPKRLLEEAGCDVILPLYMQIEEVADVRLRFALKFDEYKYARAKVPFSEKWNLKIERDRGRELVLHKMLGIKRDYIVVHRQGSNFTPSATLPGAWIERFDIVEMTPLTGNPFDWIYTIEHAAKRVMVDSVFSNLTEQLNITGENYLIQRSETRATPVYQNGWHFCWPFDPIPDWPISDRSGGA